MSGWMDQGHCCLTSLQGPANTPFVSGGQVLRNCPGHVLTASCSLEHPRFAQLRRRFAASVPEGASQEHL